MLLNIKIYAVTLVTFFVIDIIWLGLIAKNLYRKELGFIMKDSPNWIAAMVFYALFILGLVYFVVAPSIEAESFMKALLTGMFFGFITYATYDLTNLATLENWPLKITIIDLLWGTTLGGLVSSVSYFVVTKLIIK